MAYVQQPDTLAAIVKDLQRRMAVQENQSVLGNQGIQNGTLTITDASGNPQVEVGLLPDGTYGVGVLDPAGSGHIISIESLTWGVKTSFVDTLESTSSTSATSLATPGPSVTATVGESGQALVSMSAYMTVPSDPGGVSSFIELYIDGSLYHTVLEVTLGSNQDGSASCGANRLITGLTAGAHTFEFLYLTSGHLCSYSARSLTVQPL